MLPTALTSREAEAALIGSVLGTEQMRCEAVAAMQRDQIERSSGRTTASGDTRGSCRPLAAVRPKAHGVESHINANRVQQRDAARMALCVEFSGGVRRFGNRVVRGWQLADSPGLW